MQNKRNSLARRDSKWKLSSNKNSKLQSRNYKKNKEKFYQNQKFSKNSESLSMWKDITPKCQKTLIKKNKR